MTKPLTALTVLAAISLPAHANPDIDTWHVSLGLGALSMPSYLGDDENRMAFAPDVSVAYGDRLVVSSLDGVGYTLVDSGEWQAGALLKYHPGRQEDGSASYFVGGDDTADLVGLGDIAGTAEIGGFVTYSARQLQARVEMRQATDGHEGAIGELSVQWMGRTNTATPLAFSVGPEMVVGDSRFTGAFFGVDEQQSSASGLARYAARGGLVSYGVRGTVVYPLNSHWSLVGYGSVGRLSNELARSSLVATRGSDRQTSFGAFLTMTY